MKNEIEEMRVKINGKLLPRKWSDLTWGMFLDFYNTKEPAIQFFTGVGVDELKKQVSTELIIDLIIGSIKFVSEPLPKPETDIQFSIEKQSIEKKFVALNMLGMHQADIVPILGYMVALFDIPNKDYTPELGSKHYEEKVKNLACNVVYWQGLEMVNRLIEHEQGLSEELKKCRIPETTIEVAAGIQGLSRFSQIATVLMLANDNPALMAQVKKLSIGEVSPILIYKQQLSYYNWKKLELQKKQKPK